VVLSHSQDAFAQTGVRLPVALPVNKVPVKELAGTFLGSKFTILLKGL